MRASRRRDTTQRSRTKDAPARRRRKRRTFPKDQK